MSWNYEKVVADLRAEGFAPILLVSARTRPDLDPHAGELRYHFPSAGDAETQTALYNLVKRVLFEEYVRERVLAALPTEAEQREELTKRMLELARLRRRHQDN